MWVKAGFLRSKIVVALTRLPSRRAVLLNCLETFAGGYKTAFHWDAVRRYVLTPRAFFAAWWQLSDRNKTKRKRARAQGGCYAQVCRGTVCAQVRTSAVRLALHDGLVHRVELLLAREPAVHK